MTPDENRGEEELAREALTAEPTQHETITWQAHAKVEKWHRSEDFEMGLAPDEVVEEDSNTLLTAGITRLEDLLLGAGGQAYDNTHCRLGVGDGVTAVLVADTDLSAVAGSTHRQFVVMDATYPSRATTVMTFRATFTSLLGNFAWNEWGIDGGTINGTTVTAPLLNRKVPVSTLGTKGSGTTWVLSVTITIA